MSLINDDIFPRKLLQMRLFTENHFVASDANIEVLFEELLVDQPMAFLFAALKNQDSDLGRPSFEFPLPIIQGRLRNSNKVGSMNVADISQVSEERDGLERFTQTHLIC